MKWRSISDKTSCFASSTLAGFVFSSGCCSRYRLRKARLVHERDALSIGLIRPRKYLFLALIACMLLTIATAAMRAVVKSLVLSPISTRSAFMLGGEYESRSFQLPPLVRLRYRSMFMFCLSLSSTVYYISLVYYARAHRAGLIGRVFWFVKRANRRVVVNWREVVHRVGACCIEQHAESAMDAAGIVWLRGHISTAFKSSTFVVSFRFQCDGLRLRDNQRSFRHR